MSAWRLNFCLITLYPNQLNNVNPPLLWYELSGFPLTLSDQMESKHFTVSLNGSILKHHQYCFYLLEKVVAAMWKMLRSFSSTTTSFLLCPAFINSWLAYDGITDKFLELANKNEHGTRKITKLTVIWLKLHIFCNTSNYMCATSNTPAPSKVCKHTEATNREAKSF